LPEDYGCTRSEVKTLAKLNFADTGELSRARQLEIDFWRGTYSTAYLFGARSVELLEEDDKHDDATHRARIALALLPHVSWDWETSPRFSSRSAGPVVWLKTLSRRKSTAYSA